jgi:hypothetical protein
MSQDLTPQIASFFQDPDTSSAVVLAANQVAAPVVQGAALTADEVMMGGGLRVVFFVIDASPSMEPVAQLLRDGFNNDFVPAVKDAREDDTSALRIGGLAFDGFDLNPLWVGANGDHFHMLDQLPKLTINEYNPQMNDGTALHRAILEGFAQALRYAAELRTQTGIDVDIDIVILTDGANNMPPISPAKVKQTVTTRDQTRVRVVFFYFNTDWGLPDPKEYATQKLGISGEQVEAFDSRAGETKQERAKRFRRLMAVMSRVSAARNTSAVVATANVLEDDEIV